jgi:hypothetical protein
MSIKTRALALGAALALMVAAGAQPASAKKRSSAVKTATRMLTGVYLSTYTSGNVTGASAQSTVHLCGGGRFLLVSSSDVSTVIDDPSSYDHPSVGGETRTTGFWKVLKARVGTRSAWALVGYRTDQGDTGSVEIAASSRGVTVGGQPAEAGRSDVCGS